MHLYATFMLLGLLSRLSSKERNVGWEPRCVRSSLPHLGQTALRSISRALRKREVSGQEFAECQVRRGDILNYRPFVFTVSDTPFFLSEIGQKE
jgi:hypothetical protein